MILHSTIDDIRLSIQSIIASLLLFYTINNRGAGKFTLSNEFS